MSMNGYCSECDYQIEFYEGNIEKEYDKEKNLTLVYLKCPRCDERGIVTKVENQKQ